MDQSTTFPNQDWSQFHPLAPITHNLPCDTTVGKVSSAELATRGLLPTAPVRRVLVISYAFPPTGGVGVQRAAKFVKYLPCFGWQPTVLTAANPSMPIRDERLNRNVCADTRIVRARTWEPDYLLKKALSSAPSDGEVAGPQRTPRSYAKRVLRQLAMRMLQPDPQILWNGRAYRAAAKVLQEEKHAAIFVTAPPFSSFLLAERLRRQFNLPLILDFRDEWLTACRYLENYELGDRALRRHESMMHRVLRSSDAIIATTPGSTQELERHCHQAGSLAGCHCIYNGFDPDDLSTPSTVSVPFSNPVPRSGSRMRIVYTGTLWRLTNIEPLVQALELLNRESPLAASKIELVLLGRRKAEQERKVQRLRNTHVLLNCFDPLPHDQSLKVAADADWLLQLGSDEPGAERIVNAKLFEYLAMRKNILSIVPRGDAWSLLSRCGHTTIFSPEEPKTIADWLLSIVNNRPTESHGQIATSDLTPFTRRNLANKLASLLSTCALSTGALSPGVEG